MKMNSGPTQKGKAVSATQGRTRNQPAPRTNFVQKSGAGGTWANSRTDVHPDFASAFGRSSVRRKTEKK